MAFIVTLKDVLLGDVPEDGDGFVEYDIHLGIRFLGRQKSNTEPIPRDNANLRL
jgi:hypothetical protein